MQTVFVLILTFFTANNPPTAALAHEFDNMAACEKAGRVATDQFRHAAHLQVRFVCVSKS